MGRVFVVQEPMRRDPSTGDMVPMMNMKNVFEFGDPVVCLPNGQVSLSSVPTVTKLREVLRDYCDDDFLVAVGDPSAIAIASAIACDNNRGRMTLLKWDKDRRKYSKIDINIFPYRKESEHA
jgi:hypothetical protein